MSLEALLDHTCDIYHIKSQAKSPGYNLPASPRFFYEKEPNEAGVPCHFAVKSQTVTVTQTQPANIMDAKIKLTLPIGTDIRINDKIVWCETGREYTAEMPRNIRGHHLFAFVKAVGEETYV